MKYVRKFLKWIVTNNSICPICFKYFGLDSYLKDGKCKYCKYCKDA